MGALRSSTNNECNTTVFHFSQQYFSCLLPELTSGQHNTGWVECAQCDVTLKNSVVSFTWGLVTHTHFSCSLAHGHLHDSHSQSTALFILLHSLVFVYLLPFCHSSTDPLIHFHLHTDTPCPFSIQFLPLIHLKMVNLLLWFTLTQLLPNFHPHTSVIYWSTSTAVSYSHTPAVHFCTPSHLLSSNTSTFFFFFPPLTCRSCRVYGN